MFFKNKLTEELLKQNKDFAIRVVELQRDCAILKEYNGELSKAIESRPKMPRYVQVKTYMKDDPNFIQGIANLFDDERFMFFLADTMHDFIEILQKIEPGDPESVHKRARAAYRMDGVQFLINKMSEIRARYLLSLEKGKEAASEE